MSPLSTDAARFRLLAESLPPFVWSCEPDGACDYLGPQWVEYTGIPAEVQLGAGWLAQVHPEDRERVQAGWRETSAAGRPFNIEFRIRRHDGVYRWFKTLAVPIRDSNNRIVKWFGSNTDIQDLKDAEQAARESEERWRQLADMVTHLVWIADDAGVVIYINSQAARYDGFIETVGRNANSDAIVHPDDAAETRAKWRAAVASGTRYEREHRLRMADGTYRWHLSRGERILTQDGPRWLGTATDLHDIRTAEAARQEANAWFRTLADNMSQFAWMADESGALFWYNRRWYEYTGTTFEQMQGWGWKQVHHPDHVERVVARYQQSLATGEPWEDTFPLRSKSGEYRWFLSRALPIRDETGRIIRWFGTNTDVTERMRVEEELRQHREELQRLVAERTAELEETHKKLRFSERMSALGTLSAGVGHDLKNMLAPMALWLDEIARAPLPSEARQAVDALQRSTGYLRDLAAGLQSFADVRDERPAHARTDLAVWWREVHGLFRAPLPRGVVLHASIPADLPPVGIGRSTLTQAAFNLIQNAGDALADRPRGNIWVIAAATPTGVQLEIRDDGPGMSPDVQRRCLEPFFTTKGESHGTGLGLSIVHHVLEHSGVDLQLHSEPGRGTSFTLHLPVASFGAAPRRTASVSIRDARTRSIVAQILAAMRCELVDVDADQASNADLWVVDESIGDSLLNDYARSGRTRRAIRIGPPCALSPTVIAAADRRLATLRRATRRALEELATSA